MALRPSGRTGRRRRNPSWMPSRAPAITASPPSCFTPMSCGRRQRCRRSTGNCCCRTPSCPMPTRWRAGSCRSSAEKMTRFWTPEPIDVAAVLDAALGSPDPAAVIEALAPATPTYRVLRQALQDLRAGSAGRRQDRDDPLARARGEPRTRTLAAAAPAAGPRLGQRCRRAAGAVPRRSAGLLHAGHCRPGRQPQSEPGVPGLDRTDFGSTRPGTSRATSPPQEILPKASRDPNYLAQRNMVLLPDGGLQQLAGANSGLGQLMF